MKLNVHDRLILLTILPREGNFINLKIIRQVREALSFNETEIKDLNLREQEVNGQHVTAWDEKAIPEKDILFGEVVTQIIVKELKRLDETNKLTMDHVPLYEKFFAQKEI